MQHARSNGRSRSNRNENIQEAPGSGSIRTAQGDSRSMSTFVLVHGAWHGAWCWYRVVPLLEAAGHRVMAPDLPGHGIDRTPIAGVTMAAYADRICAVLDQAGEAAILVGHSMGGAIVSEAAALRPQRVRVAVYLAAFLLGDGESVLQRASSDSEGLVMPNLKFAEDESYATIAPDRVREIFYADCPDEDVALARSLLVPQALEPVGAPIHTRRAGSADVPRAYIECLQDRAIPPALQRSMQAAQPCRASRSMNTSHSPFFSAPRELVGHLLDFAAMDGR